MSDVSDKLKEILIDKSPNVGKQEFMAWLTARKSSDPVESLAQVIATAVEVQCGCHSVGLAEVRPLDRHIAEAVIAAGWTPPRTERVIECKIPTFDWAPCSKPGTCTYPKREVIQAVQS